MSYNYDSNCNIFIIFSIIYCSNLLSPGLSVVFENTQYSAMEDSSSVEVCAILQGTTAVSIAITFVAEENPQLPDSRRAISKTLTGPVQNNLCCIRL